MVFATEATFVRVLRQRESALTLCSAVFLTWGLVAISLPPPMSLASKALPARAAGLGDGAPSVSAHATEPALRGDVAFFFFFFPFFFLRRLFVSVPARSGDFTSDAAGEVACRGRARRRRGGEDAGGAGLGCSGSGSGSGSVGSQAARRTPPPLLV